MPDNDRSTEETPTEMVPKVETVEVPRPAFIPPELLARRRPAPHSAALDTAAIAALAAARATAATAATADATTAVPVREPAEAEAPAPGARARRAWLAIGVVVLMVVIVVALGFGSQLLGHKKARNLAKPAPSASVPATPVVVKSVISSFDPDPKGSGFRLQDGRYQTQTYHTRKFGNLKPGLGLLLDLGTARQLTSVDFDVADGPLTVQLRAADVPPTATLTGYTLVGSSTSASGVSTLAASAGGPHRYWLVWVSMLGPDNAAEISNLAARGHA